MADEGPIKELSTQKITDAYQLGTGYVGGKNHNSISAMGTGSFFSVIAGIAMVAFVLLIIFRSYADVKNGGAKSDFLVNVIVACTLLFCFVVFLGLFYVF